MYPYVFGIEWLESYYVMIIIGVFFALFVLRIYSGKLNIPNNVYNFYMILSLISIFVGFVFAFLFQQLYNIIDDSLKGVAYYPRGMTFMGGLIGGALVFLIGARFFAKNEYKTYLFPIVNIAAASISIAHFFGRIGCMLAGCCYGIETNSWIGIQFITTDTKVIPTQIIEAAFLLIIFIILIVLLEKKKWQNNIVIYASAYAIFRFIIEFWRGDSRGTFLPFFSPSQWQSIFILLIGSAFIIIRNAKAKKKNDKLTE